MTDSDTQLVRESFAHLHRRKAETAALFCRRLFEIAPETRPLFKSDLAAQGEKLMDMLTVALATLHDREGLVALLRKLGRQHVGYGVLDKHYDSVGEALIWTLRTSLGPAFTQETKRAWIELYGTMAKTMIEGARAST